MNNASDLLSVVNEAAQELKGIRENNGRKNKENHEDNTVAELMKNVSDSMKSEVVEEVEKNNINYYNEGANDMFDAYTWFDNLVPDDYMKYFGKSSEDVINDIKQGELSPNIIIDEYNKYHEIEKDILKLLDTYKDKYSGDEIIDIIKDHIN